MPGYPIRTPWDHSLVDSSPRPIAASHVLHRLLVPRHPPFALDNLTTKMLASTVQFSTNNQPTTHSPTPATPPHQKGHHPVCETRPCLATTRTTVRHGLRKKQPTVVPSGPNRVLNIPSQPHQPIIPTPRKACTRPAGRCQMKTRQCLRHRAPHHHTRTVRAPYQPSLDGAP
jgi:hypothetical protein